MTKEQYVRVVSAIEYTLSQLRTGPKGREPYEKVEDYEMHVDGFYKHKIAFMAYAIRYLRTYSRDEAQHYISELKKLGCDEWAGQQ